MRRVLQTLIYLVMVVVFQMPVNAMAITGAEADNSLLAEQWELSRSGDALVRIPVINKVVNQWSLKPNQRIELHYPGGEEGDYGSENFGIGWFHSVSHQNILSLFPVAAWKML